MEYGGTQKVGEPKGRYRWPQSPAPCEISSRPENPRFNSRDAQYAAADNPYGPAPMRWRNAHLIYKSCALDAQKT